MVWNKLGLAAVFAVLFFGPAYAETINITVDISDQLMYVQTDTGYDDVYPVSTARQGYHTPRGDFQPTGMQRMHYSKEFDNAPMPNSIFFYNGYAIHATYDTKHLGSPASHGCIRLHPVHAERLYEMVKEAGMGNTFISIVP